MTTAGAVKDEVHASDPSVAGLVIITFSFAVGNENGTIRSVDTTVPYTRPRTIWIANAHRGDGKRFVVHADGKRLTAFLELESTIRKASS